MKTQILTKLTNFEASAEFKRTSNYDSHREGDVFKIEILDSAISEDFYIEAKSVYNVTKGDSWFMLVWRDENMKYAVKEFNDSSNMYYYMRSLLGK